MSFNPTYPHRLAPLPPQLAITNSDFGDLLLKARVELAELKGACGQIPNPLLLIAPVVIRESVASSNIENINTTLADVLQWQLFPEAEQRHPDKQAARERTRKADHGNPYRYTAFKGVSGHYRLPLYHFHQPSWPHPPDSA